MHIHTTSTITCTCTLALLLGAGCGDDTTHASATGASDSTGETSAGTGESGGAEQGDGDGDPSGDGDGDGDGDPSGDGDGDPSGDGDGDPSGDGDGDPSGDGDGDGDPFCTPGATQCVDADTYETCDDMGVGYTNPVDCQPDEECVGGSCISLCELAENANSSVGCQYYAIDADNHDGYDALQFAIAVSNVDDAISANVDVLAWVGNDWAVQQSSLVAPGSLHQFNLPDSHINLSGIHARGAYKVVSDVPIIAYQFQPVDGVNSFTSDASLLLPVSALDQYYYVVGWGQNSFLKPEIQIVATQDNATIEVTPTTATTAGGGLMAAQANVPWQLPMLMEGDVAQIQGNNGFNGTYITSDKPISVFSSHNCANVPSLNAACCCDHLEEQTYGLQTWGTEYVAARFPARKGGTPEPSYWHILASEDNTTIDIAANAAVTGIGPQNLVLDAGAYVEIAVGGTTQQPGDFVVTADKPISVVQYMSSQDAGGAGTGDPAMSQAVPVEQFRPNYVVLVPPNWINDFLVVTKPANTVVSLDGQPIPENLFVVIGDQNDPSPWVVARLPAADGVHTLDGAQDFGVTVVGYDSYDSYAYPGGLNQQIINPQ